MIRPLTTADVEPLRRLAREIWIRHYTPIIGDAQIEYMLAQRYCSPVLLEELARGDVWWDLLLLRDEPRGFSSCFADEDERTLKLDKLYIHPDCQGAGYGRRMLERVLDRTRALGRTRVALAVNKRNSNSIRAYETWGFRIERSVVKDIGGGFVMDDYIMVRDL